MAAIADAQDQVFSPPEGHFAHFSLTTFDGNEALAPEEQASKRKGQNYKTRSWRPFGPSSAGEV